MAQYRLRNYIILHFFRTAITFTALVLLVLVFVAVTSYKSIETSVTRSLPTRIRAMFQSINSKVTLLARYYEEKMKMTLDALEEIRAKGSSTAEKFLKAEYDKKYSSDFSGLDYYVIDPKGVIFETSFKPDLRLDLSKFEPFWSYLNAKLRRYGYFVQPIGAEVETGARRIYAYKLLESGEILEIGLRLREELFLEDFESVKRLSIFLEQVSILFHGKPIAPTFDPPPEKPLPKFSYSSLYKTEQWIDFRLEQGAIAQDFKIYFRTNFRRIFLVVEWAVLLAVTVIVSLILSTIKLSRKIALEIDKIEDAIKMYGEHGSYHSSSESCFEEVNDVLRTFEKLSEIISANVQELTASNEELEASYKEIQRLSQEIKDAFYDFSVRISYIVEGMEQETAKHLQRVSFITRKICERLIEDEASREEIVYFSVLHDVGKVFIPAEILNKPGPLTPEEWEIMKKHTLYAERILSHPRFKVALNIAMYHHENYDGTGYPYGLKGEDIPLEARIVKIADIYDALTSERPYKRALTKAEALEIIFNGDGRVEPSHFDPKVLEAFKDLVDYL